MFFYYYVSDNDICPCVCMCVCLHISQYCTFSVDSKNKYVNHFLFKIENIASVSQNHQSRGKE